ncbi:hypothetical protein ACKGJN_16700, partial [Gillisia sp. Q332]|uniref:hypothetical protein n=1 Tax=Gillisia xinjiangensis TaxID=3384765 RepID=UPI00391BE16F
MIGGDPIEALTTVAGDIYNLPLWIADGLAEKLASGNVPAGDNIAEEILSAYFRCIDARYRSTWSDSSIQVPALRLLLKEAKVDDHVPAFEQAFMQVVAQDFAAAVAEDLFETLDLGSKDMLKTPESDSTHSEWQTWANALLALATALTTDSGAEALLLALGDRMTGLPDSARWL